MLQLARTSRAAQDGGAVDTAEIEGPTRKRELRAP